MSRYLLSLICLPALAADFPEPFNTEKLDPAGPMPAEEVARTMELPPGFRCQVFAAEPDVQQPIAMAWDAKGRLWVAENYTFAENPKRWDTTLRDRIIILEDKDGDGKHDGRKVFWDEGSYLTSIENGYGGVWILNEGKLSFIPDKNGDDVPDGQPEVLLDGFNTKTIGHNIVNGLRWGPDGWLYGRHGITDTSSVGAPGTPEEKRTKLNCAIWRYHPTKRTFEVVAHGGTNSWGHDWNEQGELFMINTVIGHLWHVIPGAYYRRMFGAHLNPHVYEIIEQTADHFHWDTGAESWSDIRKLGVTGKTDQLGGGHAHVGMLIYQGGTWPKEYHGAVLTCNLHGNRINVDKLERQGCGYVGKHAPDFMKAKDKWFRGIDLLTGPDGNVFVSDWSDTGECHDNDGVHRTSGRIYKIVYGETKKAVPFDLAKLEKAAAWQLVQEHPNNNWWFRMAQHLLLEASSGVKHQGIAGVGERLEKFIPDSMQRRVIKELWSSLPEPGLNTLEPFPNSEQFEQRMLSRLETWAKTEADGLERLHLASALQRLPLESRFPIATALSQHEEDADDRQQPLMIWYGIEPAVAADPMKGVELIAAAKLPTVRRLVARRIAEDFEKNTAAMDALVALAMRTDTARDDILRGMGAALQGVSQAPKPKGWDELAARSSNSEVIRNLSLVFGSGRAIEELITIIQDKDGDSNARSSAFGSLMRNPKPEHFTLVRGLINDKVLGTAARMSLAKFADADVPKALLANWPDRSQEWRAANVNTLTSRASWAAALLDYIMEHPAIRNDITATHARQIQNLGDKDVTQKLTQAWGELRDTPAAKKEELAKWTQLLTNDSIQKADPTKGKVIFASLCGACHKLYGEGGALGPDLTGGDRHKLSYLLENIIDPSAIVPADYRVSVIKLKDGRVLSGVIPEKTERSITVQSQVERLVIERSLITEQNQLPISLMPEGQLQALGEEQARHLFAYLMSQSRIR
jgi:putative membrane-bound dehydrogenase-like protein